MWIRPNLELSEYWTYRVIRWLVVPFSTGLWVQSYLLLLIVGVGREERDPPLSSPTPQHQCRQWNNESQLATEPLPKMPCILKPLRQWTLLNITSVEQKFSPMMRSEEKLQYYPPISLPIWALDPPYERTSTLILIPPTLST